MLLGDMISLLTPFEVWREDGMLCVAIHAGAEIDTHEMKEILRFVQALDPTKRSTVFIELAVGATVSARSQSLLARTCNAMPSRQVGCTVPDEPGRIMAERFKAICRPSFPFQVFMSRNKALQWFHREGSYHRL